MAISACGSQTQAASEPKGKFTVAPSASFPASQRFSEHAQMVVRVTNSGSKTIPNVGVTITDGTPSHPDLGTQVQPFSYSLDTAECGKPVAPGVDRRPGAGALRLQL